jgi:hypothetical protein
VGTTVDRPGSQLPIPPPGLLYRFPFLGVLVRHAFKVKKFRA